MDIDLSMPFIQSVLHSSADVYTIEQSKNRQKEKTLYPRTVTVTDDVYCIPII